MAFDGIGITVLHTNDRAGRWRAYTLPDGKGAILGRLFPKNLALGAVPDDIGPDASAAEKIVSSQGRFLIDNYWGRYVAFFRDEGNQCYALRDPSGGVPCFFVDIGGVRLFFSDMQDIIDLDVMAFSVNWKYVTAFLCNTHLQIAETGLEGVSQLQAGERLTVHSKGQSRIFLWDPVQISKDKVVEDFNEACHLVESTTKTCIGAWGSIYDTVVHHLSGGLDSTVVLSCLSQAPKPPTILCENQFFAGATESDERRFARIAAAKIGCRLIETEMRSDASGLDRLLNIPATPNPSLALLSFQHNYVSQLAEEHAVDAFTTGRGGDQIFYRCRQSIIAADYAWRHGLRPDFFRTALDIARLARCSIWSVLRVAIEYGLLRRSFNGNEPFLSQGFLTDSALRSVERTYHMHTWLTNAAHLPPGKMVHIVGVVDLQYLQEPSLTTRVADAPLMFASQPIVETCLRTPTYTLTQGGIDRAVERVAFIRDLPREIMERYSKGGATRYFSDMLIQSLPFIHSLLMDGTLVRQGILDRNKLERTLTKSHMVSLDELPPLLSCVAAEAWVRRWSSARQQAAA